MFNKESSSSRPWKTAAQVACLAVTAMLAWRLYLYDWADSQDLHGPSTGLAVYVAVLGVALLIFGRWTMALVSTVVAVTLFRSLSKIKADYLSSPIDASDLKNIDWIDLWTTISQYPAIVIRLTLVVGGAALLCALAARLWKGSASRPRLLGGAMAIAAAALVHHQLQSPPEDRAVGTTTSLIAFAQSFYLQAADINSEAKHRSAPTIECPKDPRNILLVLQESTFFPKALESNITASLDEFFNHGELAGPLRVHVFGGFTHLSDFAIQTGVPHSILRGDKMYASRTLQGRLDHTLAQVLKRCGYETTVIHPLTRDYFNARNWYKSVGYDHVISSEDLHHDPSQYWTVPDKVFLDAALQTAQRQDKPQFIYVLTIAQHGPHDQNGDPAAEYQRRLQDSADAYVGLMRELEKTAHHRPWIAAWFGDHRPHLIESQDLDNRYLTWFNIRSIPSSPAPARLYRPALDISFFNSALLQMAGIRNSMSYAHVNQMMRTCTDNYLGCPEDSIRTHQDLLRVSGAFAPVAQ